MDKIDCIIADDEPFALDLLRGYVEQTPFLNLIKACNNAFEVIEVLNSGSKCVLFLDIQMPGISGMQLAKMLNNLTLVVFTTAYESYAVEGYKVNALDYLLKPFNYEEFLSAAVKVRNQFEIMDKKPISNASEDFIIVKTDYKLQQIALNEITYIEGLKDYIKIFRQDVEKPVMSLMSMKVIVEKLPEEAFMRVHRSFIVNLNKIQTVERSRIIFGETSIPVSDNYKEKFHEFISGRFLQ
ncbi:MAG: LytTR family DNA-binding domain-containing protein [Bacteroidota bacterium]